MHPSDRSFARLLLAAHAVLLFVALLTILPGGTASADGDILHRAILAALLLNIALVVLIWRRISPGPTTDIPQISRRLSPRDPLTGLPTRRVFGELGAELLSRATKRGQSAAVLVLDIDRMRSINDAHGRAVGDVLLQRFAKMIADAAPSHTLLARLGGDRIAAAMVVDLDGQASVDALADRVFARLARGVDVDGNPLRPTASIGTAVAGPGMSFEALLHAGEVAVQAARSGGGNRRTSFDPGMENALARRAALENDLRAAIEERRIVPVFDRQVDLASEELTGFEILARWPHPTLGMIDAADFIPIAEEAGLTDAVTMLVLQQACEAARDWTERLTLSVNLSAVQLRDPWLAQRIVKVLIMTGFPAQRLEVELTEAALFENLALVQSTVASLKAQGVGIALDDFGIGFSSLRHLRALPLDRIKIDHHPVATMADDPDSAALVHAIARLGDSLNLPVTAEGVGNQATADRLAAIGCRRAQGRVYGPPLDIVAVRRLIVERRLLARAQGAA